jgi:membrane associated rhomboid family serine protease
MANSLDPSTSPAAESDSAQPGGWFKVGAVAAASALAGGLVAAWWYRKTLSRLREADENAHNPHFGIPEADPHDEA